MRTLLVLLICCVTACSMAQEALPEDEVRAVLDDFHKAASDADYARYFGHFAKESIFIGTDITERWTLEEFKTYAKPAFDAGNGWTYVPQSRHVYLAEDGQTAWFDEILLSERFGETRGTGVLVMEGGAWKVAQYHLTLPVPNELIFDLVDMIKALDG